MLTDKIEQGLDKSAVVFYFSLKLLERHLKLDLIFKLPLLYSFFNISLIWF